MDYISNGTNAVNIEVTVVCTDAGRVTAYGRHIASHEDSKQKKVTEGRQSIRGRLK